MPHTSPEGSSLPFRERDTSCRQRGDRAAWKERKKESEYQVIIVAKTSIGQIGQINIIEQCNFLIFSLLKVQFMYSFCVLTQYLCSLASGTG